MIGLTHAIREQQFSELSSLFGAFAAGFMSAVFLRPAGSSSVLQVAGHLRSLRMKGDVFMSYAAYENPDLNCA